MAGALVTAARTVTIAVPGRASGPDGDGPGQPGTVPAGEPGPPVDIPRDPARRAAEDELSDPAYHQDDPGLFRRALDWLFDNIGRLLSSAADASPGGTVGLAVIVGLVIILLLALRLRLGTPRREPATDRAALFTERPRTAAEHRAAAEAHAEAHHWSQALQERVRALMRTLEERALLEPRPGRTADESAAEAARALPGHREPLRAAAHAFDEVTYAGRPCDQAAYHRVRDLDQAVRSARPELTADTAGPAPERRRGRP